MQESECSGRQPQERQSPGETGVCVYVAHGKLFTMDLLPFRLLQIRLHFAFQ